MAPDKRIFLRDRKHFNRAHYIYPGTILNVFVVVWPPETDKLWDRTAGRRHFRKLESYFGSEMPCSEKSVLQKAKDFLDLSN